MVNFVILPPCLPVRSPVPSEQKPGWSKELVWTLEELKKTLPPDCVRNPGSPALSLVTVNIRRECYIYMFVLFPFNFPIISLSLLLVPSFAIFHTRLFPFSPSIILHIYSFFRSITLKIIFSSTVGDICTSLNLQQQVIFVRL